MDARLRGSAGVTTTQTECFKGQAYVDNDDEFNSATDDGWSEIDASLANDAYRTGCGCSISLLHLVPVWYQCTSRISQFVSIQIIVLPPFRK